MVENGWKWEESKCPWLRIIELLSLQNGSKTRKNSRKTETSWRKTKQPGEGTATTVHLWQPPWVAWVVAIRVPSLVSLPLVFLIHPRPWYLLCFTLVKSFWTTLAIFLWLTLVNLNSVKTLKTSKTTHNRRNRGINHINIHFNPLKWLLNTQLIHANMTLISNPLL